MDSVNNLPNTLLEAVTYFSNPDNCLTFLSSRRWPTGEVTCPRCGSNDVGFIASRRVWQCKTRHLLSQFSIKVGTIFEDSPLGLDKWLPALWMIGNDRNGISSWELHRALGVTQKTAWFMLHRIRLAMQDTTTGGLLGGEVEVDETFIGGKARNMHKDRKRRVQKDGRNTGGKAIVLGLIERASEKGQKRVRTAVVKDRKASSIRPIVTNFVEPGTQLMADEHGLQWKMDEYTTSVVNHLECYVKGNVHTNSVENFWSLLKRSIGETYVNVEPFHLFRYVDEQAFRFNNRLDVDGDKLNDLDRFEVLVSQIVGRRVQYKELIGKPEETIGA